MKKLLSLALIVLTTCFQARSDEGMWIPLFLGEFNEAQMQAMGMKITADDIYSVNHSSLKDAIVIFGGGCTGEVVSDQGLLLTNHHCGFRSIQKHSSIEHDYLTNGFWAKDKSEELTNPGLTVTFLIRMEEVTAIVLDSINTDMTEAERRMLINRHIKSIKEEATKDTHYKAVVKPFFLGNRYFLFVNEIFEDVRLVGAPPSNIGKFGGDTDNWMWPRHTGDFSIFRIYADKDNNPAKYSEDNVPYQPKKHLSISLDGINEGDFTFIFGYPGSTEEYIPSYAVDMTVNTINPIRISLRGKRLGVIKKYMNDSPEIRIQYAAKQAGISNGWKKWIGENRGIKRLHGIEKKEAFEKEFQKWSSLTENQKYNSLLSAFKETYDELYPLKKNLYYVVEGGLGIELIKYANSFSSLVNISNSKDVSQDKLDKTVKRLKKSTSSYFKDYQPEVDKEVFAVLFKTYYENVDKDEVPEEIQKQITKYKENFILFADEVFKKSMFASKDKIIDFLDNYKASQYKKIKKDPAYKIASAFIKQYKTNYYTKIAKLNSKLDSLMRIYMKAQMEMQPNKLFYPDANFTLRIAYGNVMGYNPADAVTYNYFTTLEGIMEKEDPDIYDYVVEDKLKDLYNNKDYGIYGNNGKMQVCFIANNHTTGGNSGSPVLDANGNLIGINFDRCWEGTMSDIMYDPDQSRNIMLDIRYCLFIIDKFAGAGHLVDEMTIVKSE